MTCIMQQQSKSFFEIFYAIKNGFAAGKNKKFFKKVLTLALYFAILSYIVFQKTMKTEYYIVSGFAKNNGRGAKAISTAKQNKGQASRFCEKGTFAEAFERMPFFVCWGRGKYPLDCHFGGELSLVLSRRFYEKSPAKHLCKNVCTMNLHPKVFMAFLF